MNSLRHALRLTTLTVLLTTGLFSFTLITLEDAEAPLGFGCATVNMADDVLLKQNNTLRDHPGLMLFEANCRVCHRLDKIMVGPALRNSFATRDSIWFVKMIVSANELITSGDTMAVQLFEDYGLTRHPDYKGFDEQELADLVEYLKLEGQREIQNNNAGLK
ncbi:MAG: cytochrome c [Chryseolinea sp.]